MNQRLCPRPPHVERLERVEMLGSRFEAEWQQGHTPDALTYLEEANSADRPILLRELLLIEWWHREKRGKQLDVEVYRQQFRFDAPVVEDAWRAWGDLSTSTKTNESVVPSTIAPDGRPTHSLRDAVPADLLPPTILGYTEVVKLGDGGMGVVYRARHVELGRLVALKMVLPEKVSGERLQRFRIEAKALARLQHPHIVQVYDWETTPDGSPVLVMEYIPGQTLKERLQRPLSPLEAARLVAILARAVQAAHVAGIVHRDLKPANVLMAAAVEGNAGTVLGGFPKVSDFGLARLVEGEQGQSLSGDVMGTPAYMAPEQARGSREVGPAADVWALGVILFQCVSCELPFVGDSVLDTLERIRTLPVPTLAARVEGVPAELDSICRRCLDKDASGRPSAAELAQMLERFAAGDGVKVSGLAQTPKPLRAGASAVEVPAAASGQRRRRWPVVVLLVGMLLATVASLTFWLNKGPGLSSLPPVGQLPADLKELTIFVGSQAPGQRVLSEHRERELVVAGADRLQEPLPALTVNDAFRLYGAFTGPTYWYLIWFDTEGKFEVNDTAQDYQAEMAYPSDGKWQTVNPADHKGVHLLMVLAADLPPREVRPELERTLRDIGRPPQTQPRQWAVRGGGERVGEGGEETHRDYLYRIRRQLPKDFRAVYSIWLPTR